MIGEEKIKDLVADEQYKPCSPINASKKAIYEYAGDVRKHCQVEHIEIDETNDLWKLIKEILKGEIHAADITLWEKIILGSDSGTIFIRGKNDFDIILPDYTSPLRDKFTLAHELGHYLLHNGGWQTPLKAFRSGSNERVEWEANWFAAGFLMPKKEIDEVAKEVGGKGKLDGEHISIHFGVSMDAAAVRLETYQNDKL